MGVGGKCGSGIDGWELGKLVVNGGEVRCKSRAVERGGG